MSKAISRRDFMKVTGAVGAAGLLAACGGNSAASSSAASTAPAASADESLALSDGPVSMTISWWGGDSRHEAYQNAIKEFQAEHTPKNTSAQPLFAISEAQILKSVQHPGIPTIYDFDDWKNSVFKIFCCSSCYRWCHIRS